MISYSSNTWRLNAQTLKLFISVLIVVLFMVVGFVFQPAGVSAVRNNNGAISEKTLRSLRSNNQDVNSAYVNNRGLNNTVGAWCKEYPAGSGNENKYHFQDAWLSVKDEPRVTDITINEGSTPSVALQYNTIGGTCHRIFSGSSPSTSTINDISDLRTTATKILDSSAKISGVRNLEINLSEGRIEDMDYAYAYSKNYRFVKREGGIPYNEPFTVSGLSALPAGQHTIVVTVEHIMVNQFGTSLFRCVNGGNQTNNLNDSAGNCEASERTLEIDLTVRARYDARCEIRSLNGVTTSEGGEPTGSPVYMTPGQSFKAIFAVRNSGTEPWEVVQAQEGRRYFRLGSRNPENTQKWGPNRVDITGPPNQFGGAVLAAGSLSPAFEHEFTVPTTAQPGNDIDFRWQVVHDGGTFPASQGWLGADCFATISIKANQPYLRISGGDVRAGAWFDDGSRLQCGVDQESAKSADIKTAGFWDSNSSGVNLRSLGGVSSSQYAVLATGLIGSSGNNNFTGGNAAPREVRKDLTFANSGVENDGYGNFYEGQSAYCQDIASLVDGDTESLGSTFSDSNVTASKTYYKQDGNLTIDGNVIYKSSYASTDDIPRLTVIVRGNIYIPRSVTQLDGTFIAIPDENGNGGIVDTCSDVGEAGEWPDAGSTGLSAASCDAQLTINGRLIARDVIWKRTAGTIGSSNSILVDNCVVSRQPITNPETFVAALEKCAAEFVNLSPEAYFGRTPGSDSNPTNNVGNVPVYSIELPPIY